MWGLRPYVTIGVALVGVGAVAMTPVVPSQMGPQSRDVQLAQTDSPFGDLISNTTENLDNIANNADLSAITTVVDAVFTRPLDVLDALTDISPDVTTDLSGLPATVSVELSPALELGIAGLGAFEATVSAINGVVGDLMSGDSQDTFTALLNGGAEVADAYLNGQEGIELLGGLVNIPLFNGILAPDQALEVDLNLTELLDTLGLGDLDLGELDLSGLLDKIGLGELNLGDLFNELGISGDKLGDLLQGDADTLTLGDVLTDFGLGDLDLGQFSLTDILDDLGLNSLVDLDLTDILDGLGLNPDLNGLSLADVLDPLGLNADLGNLGLNQVIEALGLNFDVGDVGLGSLLDALGLGGIQLGDLLDETGLLQGVLDGLLGSLGSILDPLGLGDLQEALNNVTLADLLDGVLLGQEQNGGLSLTGLLEALGLGDSETDDSLSITGLVESLLGEEPTTDTTLGDLITGILGSAGIDIPDTGELHITDLLTDLLGAAGLPSTDDLTLGSLLDDLNIFNLDVANLLNTVDLGGLLDMLGLPISTWTSVAWSTTFPTWTSTACSTTSVSPISTWPTSASIRSAAWSPS